MKEWILKFTARTAWALLPILALSACSLQRSDSAGRLRIQVADQQGRPIRSVSNYSNSSDLFDSSGHARSSIKLTSAPNAACFFVGITGNSIKSSIQGRSIAGITSSCTALSDMGQVSDLVSFKSLQDRGVSVSLTVGQRAFTLYAVNIKDAEGCPFESIEKAFEHDPLLTIFAYAKGDATLDRQTTNVSLSQVDSSTLDSAIPAACYDAKLSELGSLTATAVSKDEIDLSWTDTNSREAGVVIERFQNGAFSTIATLSEDSTGYKDTGLTSKTTYTYRVKVYNMADSLSAIVEATTLANPPTAPSSLVASPSSATSFHLAWTDNSNNETKFTIDRSVNGTTWTEVGSTASGVVAYDDTALTGNKRYYYRVRAENGDGSSSASNTSNSYTLPSAPLSALAVGQSSSHITVTWANGDSANPSSFTIQRCLLSNFNTIDASANVDGGVASFDSNPPDANTLYFYRVYATNSAGDSAFSNTASDRTKIAAPVVTAQVVSDQAINLNWSDVDGADGGYILAYKLHSATSYGSNVSVGAGIVTWPVTSLSPNTSYDFKLIAHNNSTGDSAPYVVTQSTGVSSPSVSVTVLSDTSIKLDWPAVDGADSIAYSYKLSTESTYGGAATLSGTATTKTQTGLTPNREYNFKLIAHNNSTGDSAPAIVTGTTKVAAPAVTLTVLSDSSIQLNWTSIDGADSYIFDYKLDTESTYGTAETLTAATTSKTVSSLTPYNLYNFRLIAHNDTTGNSSATITSATTRLAAPSVTATVLSDSSIKLDWQSVSGADNYILDSKLSSANSFGTPETITGITKTVTGLAPNQQYDFRLVAHSTLNGDSAATIVSPTTKVAAPTATATVISDTELKLEWDAVSGADSYTVDYKLSSATTYGGSSSVVSPRTKSFTALTANKSYDLRVVAHNDVTGDSSATVKTISTNLAFPIVTSSSATSNSTIEIVFDKADGAATYHIEWQLSTELESGSWTELSSVADNGSASYTVTDTGRTEALGYRYRLWSTDATRTSAKSSSFVVRALLTAPDQLTAVLSTSTERKIRVEWRDNSGSEDGFEIWRSESDAAFALLDSVGVGVTHYDDIAPNVTLGKSYRYKIRAYQTSNSLYSNYTTPSTAVTPVLFPPTAASITSVTDLVVNLAWTDNSSDKTAYEIERKDDGAGSFNLIAIKTSTPWNGFSDSSISVGHSYEYRLRAIDSSTPVNRSEYATISGSASPGAPNDMAATAYAAHIELAWSRIITADGYDIDYNTDSASPGAAWLSLVTNQPNANISYSHLSLVPGMPYFYRIRAIYPGTNSAWSYLTSATLDGKITGLSLTPTAGTVGLAWTRINDADDYELEYKLTGDPTWTSMGNVPPANPSKTHDALMPGTHYLYHLRAIYGVQHSDWTEGETDTISGLPVNFNGTASGVTVTLTWDRYTEANSYDIEYKIKADLTYTPMGNYSSAVTTASQGALQLGGEYTFRMRSVFSAPDKVSAWVTKTITLGSGVPTNFTVQTSTDTSVTVQWTDVAGEDSYDLDYNTVAENLTESDPRWFSVGLIYFDSTSKLHEPLTAGVTYYYRLRASYSSNTIKSQYATVTATTNSGWTITGVSGDLPSTRYGHTAVWTGETGADASKNRMLVWGGTNGTYDTGYFSDGAIYNPSGGTWTAMSSTNAPEKRAYHTAIWTGNSGPDDIKNKMIVWGGYYRDTGGATVYVNSGGIFDPKENKWRPLNNSYTNYSPTARVGHSVIWTGSTNNAATSYKMIIWGGTDGISNLSSGSIFDLAASNSDPAAGDAKSLGDWASMTGNPPAGRAYHTAVWTGDTGATSTRYRMIVWGGSIGPFISEVDQGKIYDPETGIWATYETMLDANTPVGRKYHSAIWTGATGVDATKNRMIVWGGLKTYPTSSLPSGGGKYDMRNYDQGPPGDSWAALSTSSQPDGRYGHLTVWTGDTGNDLNSNQMIVWGGSNLGSQISGGGIYSVSTSTWTGTPTTNEPGVRADATMVFTGTIAIIWGGRNGSAALNDGASFTVAPATRGTPPAGGGG